MIQWQFSEYCDDQLCLPSYCGCWDSPSSGSSKGEAHSKNKPCLYCCEKYGCCLIRFYKTRSSFKVSSQKKTYLEFEVIQQQSESFELQCVFNAYLQIQIFQKEFIVRY